jgi:hypothetical protein
VQHQIAAFNLKSLHKSADQLPAFSSLSRSCTPAKSAVAVFAGICFLGGLVWLWLGKLQLLSVCSLRIAVCFGVASYDDARVHQM